MLITALESIADIFGNGVPAERRNGDLFSSTAGAKIKRHESLRGSGSESGELPIVLIPMDFDLQSFFADVATFYPSYSPVTAFIHVLGRDSANLFNDRRDSRYLDRANERLILASLGVALGETMALGLHSAEASALPSYSACRRSLSFAINRSRFIYPSCESGHIASRWTRLRELTGLEVAGEILHSVVVAHSLIFHENVRGSNSAFTGGIQASVAKYIAADIQDRDLVLEMSLNYPGLSDVLSDFEGPFDGRMKAFTRILELVDTSAQGPELGSLVIGYFCNRIFPGSFNHPRLLARVQSKYPSALIWYGLFCSLSDGFEISQFASGLLAKLSRDVRQPFNGEERPVADISLEELEVLARLPIKSDSIKPTHQKIASVSILPGVDIFSRFSLDDEKSPDQQRRREIESAEIDARIGRLLKDAMSLLDLKTISPQPLVSPQSSRRLRKTKS
jgi:hypothetical protein